MNLSWSVFPESPEEMMGSFDDFEYLDVYQLPASCADEYEEAGGAFMDVMTGTTEVRVGDVVLQIDSTLDEATLDSVIASFVPADVPAMVDRFNERQQQLMDEGFPPGF